jgi:MFS transporter, SP family, sugar:H+ symporter
MQSTPSSALDSSRAKMQQEHGEHSSNHIHDPDPDHIAVADLPQAITEKGPELVDTPIPLLTWRSAVMGLFVSMGGFLFGYDTGQISGFLEMEDFLARFGQFNASTGKYVFSNVRSGLVVALVSYLSRFPLI